MDAKKYFKEKKKSEPIDWELAYPSSKSVYGKDAPILVRGAPDPLQKLRDEEKEKESLLRRARKVLQETMPKSKGSAGRESSEKQRDKDARVLIRAGVVK